MSEKSHVGMGYSLCPVCCTRHDDVVLLDRRLKPTLTKEEFMGWSLCPEHQRLKDDGYIAMIEVKNEPNGMHDADRTGTFAHIRASVWPQIFNSPPPPAGVCFIHPEVMTMLQRSQE